MPLRSLARSGYRLSRRAALALLWCTIAGLAPASVLAQPVSAPSAVQTRVALTPGAQRFFALVRENFAAFDRNHDGTLTREEIEIDMQNPRIMGDVAAALAALKLAATESNHLNETHAYTLAEIDAMEQTLQSTGALKPNLVKYFENGRNKQAEVPRTLFFDGGPRLAAIRQDWTTDCYFLATIGSLAHSNPQALVRLITPNPDGSYIVAFPGKRPVRVSAPTDTELAAYSNAKDGIWLGLLEKAYGMTRIADEPQQAKTREPLNSVGFRTGSTRVVEVLTGHTSKFIGLPANTHKPADPRLFQELRADLQAAVHQHRAVMLSNSHHSYSIVGFDPAADKVTIHNPYHRSGTEMFADGSKAERTDGFFTLSTTQVVNYFNYLHIETNQRKA